jgi:hypothetical protein
LLTQQSQDFVWVAAGLNNLLTAFFVQCFSQPRLSNPADDNRIAAILFLKHPYMLKLNRKTKIITTPDLFFMLAAPLEK